MYHLFDKVDSHVQEEIDLFCKCSDIKNFIQRRKWGIVSFMFKKLKRSAIGANVPHEKVTATMKAVALPLPELVRIPMSMHIGAPATPVVKKGDEVFVGTLIGEASGFVSANIHASVSGTVSAIEAYLMPNGKETKLVAIKPDGTQTVDPSIGVPNVTDKQSFLDAVLASGIVGLGGAGFPTHVKLQPKAKVDTLLINASECEVLVSSDTREMLDWSDTLLSGIEAVMKYCEIPNCIIGIERNKPECIDLLCSLTTGMKNVTVKPLPSVYGTGAELILIEKCLGREVPHGKLPADVGTIVLNVSTASSIGKYLVTGMPLVERRITVDGDVVAKPGNFMAPVGAPTQMLVDAVGLLNDAVLGKVVAGGAMMGPAIPDLSAPLTKTSVCLSLYGEKLAVLPEAAPCIRCGRCIDYCPLGLEPVNVATAFEAKDVATLGKLHADYCFNCGSCSFICPAKRPVTQMMGLAKEYYMNQTKGGAK